MKSELESLKDKLDQEIKERKIQTEEYMKQLQVYQQKMEKTEDLNMKLIDAVTGNSFFYNFENYFKVVFYFTFL